MLKIAYILTPIDFGGSERVNLTFLKNVNRSRFDVFPVLLIRPWEKENYFQEQMKVLNYTYYHIPVAIKPRSAGKDYLRIARCFYALYKILSSKKYHIVHTHGYFADIIGITVSRLLRIPSIATCHGFISNDIRLNIYNRIDKIMLRYCDKVITVSEEIKSNLVKCGVNEANIINIQNAAENELSITELNRLREEKRRKLLINEDECVIGYAGRLSKEKGLHYLIRAVSILKKDNVQVKVLIMGDGQNRNELEKLTLEERIHENIIFTGYLKDVENWLSMLDIFILPSLSEGTPMALLEAMSKGIPVIASRVGGIPMVVDDNISGFLIEPGNSAAIAEKIRYLKENKDMRNKMGIEASKTVKIRFDVRDWCRRIEKEYDDILSKVFNS